jgi:hypothetical protein
MDLTVIVPLHSEVEWFASIEPLLLEISLRGGQVLVGLNFKDKTLVNRIEINKKFRSIESTSTLNAAQHWNKLRNQVQTKYVRYWFAGDVINLETLSSHLKALEQNSDLSLVFSARGVHYRKLTLPKQNVIRLNYWGKSEFRIDQSVFLESVAQTGTNYIGEPSFVTFRVACLTDAWKSDLGYAIELDFYMNALKNGPGYWIPLSSGSFGLTTGSGSITLLTQQYNDLIKWYSSVQRKNQNLKRISIKMRKQFRKRRLIFQLIKHFEYIVPIMRMKQ